MKTYQVVSDGKLHNYFIIYHNVITEIKRTTNVMLSNRSKTISHSDPWKNCLPQNCFLVPKVLGTAALQIIQNIVLCSRSLLVIYFTHCCA